MAATLSVYFKAIDQISEKLNAIADSGRKVSDRLDELRNGANDAFERMQDGSQRAGEAMNNADRAAAQYASSIGDAGKATGEASDGLDQFATKADEAEKEVRECGEEAKKAGENSEDFGKRGKEAAITLGDALVAAGIVKALKEIGEAFVDAAETAAEFETSMAKLSTIADDSVLGLDEMTQQVRELSMSSGRSASDLAEAAYQAISASVDTADAVSFVAQANKLAAGGFTESATAVDVLTTAINAYGMSADDANMIADRLINTQNLGKTTVDELASSMGTVIPTAAAFSVSLDNLASGYVTLTRNGINTANATTMLNGMFSELADSGSEVAGILIEKTGKSFTQLMEEGASLGDVIQILGDYVDGDSTAFVNLWGNIRAGRGAINIFNAGAEEFNNVMQQMEESTGAADKAFQKMANTSEVTNRKLQTATENLKIAVGDVLMPVFDQFKEKATDVLNKITEFVTEHPKVVAAIAAGAAALGTFVAVMTSVTIGVKLASAAWAVFTAVLEVNPIVLAAAAIAALVVGIAAFVSATYEAYDAEEQLTYSARAHEEQLEELNQKYDEAVEKYGAQSKEAGELAVEIAKLESSYEHAGETIGEFKARIEETGTAIADIRQKYDDNIKATDELFSGSTNLASQLMVLSESSDTTGANLEMMKGIVNRLNSSYADLGLTIDDTTGKLNMSVDKLYDVIQKDAENQKKQAATDALTDAIARFGEARKLLIESQHESGAAFNAYKDAEEQWRQEHPILKDFVGNAVMNWDAEAKAAFNDWQVLSDAAVEASDQYKQLESDIRDYCDALGYTTEETDQFIAQLKESADAANGMGDALAQVEDAAQNTGMTFEEFTSEMESAFTRVQDQAKDLAAAYDQAREAAESAVESSVGLFEKIDKSAQDATQSAMDMVEALKSQDEYFRQYADNLEKAKEYGIDESLVEKLADGSQESAAQLDEIISHIESLGPATEEAKGYIEELNTAFESVEEAKDVLEETMVAMNTTLTEQTAEMQATMEQAVQDLNLEGEAAEAGAATMQAYLDQIVSIGSQAVSEAQSIASQVQAALSAASVSMSSAGGVSVAKHASGTTYGENLYIAGEQGTELIVGRQGSEVFPASETAKILNALAHQQKEYQAPPAGVQEVVRTSNMNSKKDMTITINGKGGFGIGSDSAIAEIKDSIMGNLEGTLMKLLMTEIYQEGAVAREF